MPKNKKKKSSHKGSKHKDPYRGKSPLGKFWYFIWHDNSIWSWIANLVLAYVLIKFLLYPGLGLVLSTDFPIVAVVSGSMEHNQPFDEWWGAHQDKYSQYDISKEDFREFPMKEGFNKGDLMVLAEAEPKDLKRGDIIVFWHPVKQQPIIHRIIKIKKSDSSYYFQTKGDHNPGSAEYEKTVPARVVVGKAVFRIPLLGWVKVGFVDLLKVIGLGG